MDTNNDTLIKSIPSKVNLRLKWVLINWIPKKPDYIEGMYFSNNNVKVTERKAVVLGPPFGPWTFLNESNRDCLDLACPITEKGRNIQKINCNCNALFWKTFLTALMVALEY